MTVAEGTSSVPFTFGPPERALFGWYHPPRSTPRDAAVLLCSPVGWEALTTQRTYHELAERLSEAGFATLRFDLDGTGDSAGTDADPERLQAWMQSIELAVAELRALSGRQQVGFFGIHFGATLAAYVAATGGWAATAVLWAPYLQGRQLARQIRAYGALNLGVPAADGDQDAAGFLYRADTLDALSKIDLVKSNPAAPHVLLLQKAASSNEEKLATAWRERGAQVTCEARDGYGEMMQESRNSQVPDQVIDRVVEWLSAAHPIAPDRPPKAVVAVPNARGVREPGLEEELCFFGPGSEFFGILTRPDRGDPEGPAIVFLNTSSDYRVGPSRMYVPLSRQLAALGLTSIRFDPTGIGDHRGPRGDDPAEAYSERRVQEAQVVLDFLECRGIANRFILVGLCSGAYNAFHAGVRDARVVGTVLINPQTFTWQPGDSLELKIRESFRSTHYYKRAIRQFVTWKRALSGEVNMIGVARILAKRLSAPLLRLTHRAMPPRWSNGYRVDRGFQTVLDRGASVLVIFDEDDGGRDVLEWHVGKDGKSLRRYPRFRLQLVHGADHTFSRVQDQRTLFALLRDYLGQQVPVSAAATRLEMR